MNLAPKHLRRYKDVRLVFLMHGSASVIEQGGFASEAAPDQPTAVSDASKLADDLEALGPTFVKIGQLLSTRGDLLPPPYLDALSRLQDKVSPIPYEEIEKTVQDELGVRISKGFDSFDETPLAAASLGQVHVAVLRGGRPVAVKVQRPGIRQEIIDDVDSLHEIAEFLDLHTDFGRKYETSRIVEQFRNCILREPDYQKEASHLAELKRNLKEFGRLRVPAAVEDYTTSRVLTMDYFPHQDHGAVRRGAH